MNPKTIALLQRVNQILGEGDDWFKALQEWYEHSELTRRMLEAFLDRDRAGCVISLAVNGHLLDGAFRHGDRQFQKITWMIPATWLHAGNNDVVVALERGTEAPLLVNAAGVEEGPGLSRQTLDLTVPEPARTARLGLGFCRQAHYQAGRKCWTLQANGGLMQFDLRLSRAMETNFTLNLAAGPGRAWAKLLWDLLDKILDAIQKKRKELEEAARRLAQRDDPRADQVRRDLDDLEAYERLHQLQVEPAVLADPPVPLEKVIAASGRPAGRIPRARSAQPPRQPLPPPRLTRGPLASGVLGGAVKWLLVLVFLVAGGLVFAAWKRGDLDALLGDRGERGLDLKKRLLVKRIQDRKAGTGDVQISLSWENKDDLDLHVVCPSGEQISFANRRSKCGGQLDVDMNVHLAKASSEPVENVFWAKAPKGRYQIYVHYFGNHRGPAGQGPTPFTVRVLVRGAERWFTGEVVHGDPNRGKVLVHEFVVD